MADLDDEEESLRARLARLRQLPTDTSGVESKLERKLEHLLGERRRRRVRRIIWFSAAFSLAVAFAAALWWSRTPTLDIRTVAMLHREIAANRSHAIPITSFDALSRDLDKVCPGHVVVPKLAGTEAEGYCVRRLGRQEVVCIHLRSNRQQITMVIAQPAKFHLPVSLPAGPNQPLLYASSYEGCAVVVVIQTDRLVALAGETTTEALLQLASGLSRD